MSVREQIVSALKKATGEGEIGLNVPEIVDHGDYSTNVALKAKKPKEQASELIAELQKDEELAKIVEKIEVAGPGFINFWLKEEALVDNLALVLEAKEKYGSSDSGADKKVIVEYSSPNIAKRFGIGHLRSTIIGQAIYNFYKFLGYETIGENHLGDWGSQFGAILAELSIQNSKLSDLAVDDLEKLYVEFNKKLKGKPELWDEAKAWFKKLEGGDAEARKKWETVREISLVEFEKVYKRLGVKIDHAHGESYYEDKMDAVVKFFHKKGLSKKSEGAEIVEFPKTTGLSPAMLIKSDGTTTYFTRDLAAIVYRTETWHPQKILYEVGSDQVLHFKQVFAAAALAGWTNGLDLFHIAHGLIRLSEGKMSTRKGTTIKLEEVLDEAVAKAKKFNPDNKIAEAVGIGAIKYFDLMHAPTSDFIFDWDKMLALEGNSGPYLQYTYARAESVIKKAKQTLAISHAPKFVNINTEELLLMRLLIHFPEIIESAAKSYSPNLLCSYLFDLAQKYNTFYNKHRIIDSDNLELRLGLTAGTGQVIKNGLTLLGIQTPEQM